MLFNAIWNKILLVTIILRFLYLAIKKRINNIGSNKLAYMKNFTHQKFVKIKYIDKIFVLFFLFFFGVGISQNFQNVAVTGVISGRGTNNALFNATSPTITLLAFIRAKGILGPKTGNFTIQIFDKSCYFI